MLYIYRCFEGSTILQNVCNYSAHNTTYHSRRPEYSATLLRKFQFSRLQTAARISIFASPKCLSSDLPPNISRSCMQRTVMDAPLCVAESRCRLHLCDSLHTPPFMYCLKGHRHKILAQIILKHLNRRWVSLCTVARGDRTYRVTLFVPCAEEIKCWSLHKFQKPYIARVIVVCTM